MTGAAMPAAAPVALSVADVTVRFGGLTALLDVGFTAHQGEVVGIIGPNGAGKTTLFNVLCGFVRPDTARVDLGGRSLGSVKPHQLTRLGVGRTLQALGLFPHMSVLENVMVGATSTARAGFGSALLGLPRSDSDERRLRARALEVLAGLGVADTAGRVPGSLPYPVQKRVSLARALASDPKLLLLDEPASGLSGEEMGELGELIRSLSERMTVLLVEHHMDLVMSVCDSIVVLNFGEVLATGSPEQVRSDPRVLEAYLGDAPQAADEADEGGPRVAAAGGDDHADDH